jgi:hypothetical protein
LLIFLEYIGEYPHSAKKNKLANNSKNFLYIILFILLGLLVYWE